MSANSDRFHITAAWIWIIAFALFRYVYSGQFLLVPDETNYWQWSRHLALGYHDQAPLIAWAIKLTTSILGHTETGVRLPSVFALTVASAYLIMTAYRYVGAYAAWATALISQAILEARNKSQPNIVQNNINAQAVNRCHGPRGAPRPPRPSR